MDKDTHKEDLKTYRNIETWGTALSLSGIALAGKFIFETRVVCEDSLPPWSSMVTSSIGLYAFVFLLVVNRRSRQARALIDRGEVRYRGVLGWLFACMPVLFGWAISYAMHAPPWYLVIVGVVAVFIAIFAFWYDYKKKDAE